MVKILDFLPPQVLVSMAAMDQRNLDIDIGNHFFMTGLPLRYVLQYALNHLRGMSIDSSHIPGSVLLVTRSRAELQTLMHLEQERIKTTTNLESRVWRHLFSEDPHNPVIATDQESPVNVFEPELWSRIHMRYAPTIDHVQSLFQGLHLEPEDTNGITSFGNSTESPVLTEDSEEGPPSHTRQLPSLVILVGCFSPDYTFPNDQDSDAALEEDATYLENVNTLTSSKAMSVIKDSLDWIANTSGRNVGLAIFENTALPTLPTPSESSTTLTPSPKDLWLERTIGFWVDAILTVERKRPLSTATESNADSFRLRIKTHEAIQKLLDAGSSHSATTTDTTDRTLDPQSVLSGMASIEWDFDYDSSTFRSAVSIE
ncbi:hypothetical protein EMPS_00663 [Entomortierella parvispora]|uniref:Uncharacterized protein n=1 Tax=Entomortierella parvispora TaxID=205924 RepID=A0A9P3LS27_9FUNG|nr:hypothetical protein EMPS_00663 [Entomortierella parvispora]